MQTDKELADELEAIYKQVAEENIGETKSAFEKSPVFDEIHSKKQRLPPARHSNARVFVLILLLSALLAVYFWPSIYYEGFIKSGDKTFPVKTNRITGKIFYYHGDKWHGNPIPTAKPFRSPITVSIESPPAENTSAPINQPLSKGRYTIQIKALKDLKKVNYLSDILKKRGLDAYWEKVDIKDKGSWYRVFIGQFSDASEAERYMKENKIDISYPGSFIQKVSIKQP